MQSCHCMTGEKGLAAGKNDRLLMDRPCKDWSRKKEISLKMNDLKEADEVLQQSGKELKRIGLLLLEKLLVGVEVKNTVATQVSTGRGEDD